jgi:ubiquinone biosynthesis accessory factor UbiJ
MIKSYTLKALQKAINHGLALDEDSASRIKALDGKVLQIVIKPLKVSFYILFTEQKLELQAHFSGEVHTIIESSPLGLIRLSLLPASRVRSLFNDQIKMTGDTEVGQKVKQLFDDLDIDWEGHLAQFTGDVVAHQVGSFFRKGQAFKDKATETFKQNMSEYIHDEVKLFPHGEEIDDFFHDVDELALDVERISARINQLMVKNESN